MEILKESPEIINLRISDSTMDQHNIVRKSNNDIQNATKRMFEQFNTNPTINWGELWTGKGVLFKH